MKNLNEYLFNEGKQKKMTISYNTSSDPKDVKSTISVGYEAQGVIGLIIGKPFNIKDTNNESSKVEALVEKLGFKVGNGLGAFTPDDWDGYCGDVVYFIASNEEGESDTADCYAFCSDGVQVLV